MIPFLCVFFKTQTGEKCAKSGKNRGGNVNKLWRILQSKRNRDKLLEICPHIKAEKEELLMYCKYCASRLEKGSTVCPACGKDNGEKKEGIVITPGKLAISICAVVVLVAVLAAVLFSGMAGLPGKDPSASTPASDVPGGVTDPAASTPAPGGVTDPSVEATVPEDTGLNDPTCKGSYTVSDEEVIAAKAAVVATLGEKKLTNAQLQICYWLQVQNFFSSEDFTYLYYYYQAIDYTKPLDTQVCYYDPTLTWQQYFLRSALEAWQSYQIMASEAEAAGFQLPKEYREQLDAMPESMAKSAQENGFASVDALIAANVGTGASLEDYTAFWEMYYLGYTYYDSLAAELEPTDAEAEAFFDEHVDIYMESGITKDTVSVDVRHILIMPQGATSANIRTETFPEEAWAASKTEAETILQQWLANPTEENFGKLANEHSDDQNGQVTNGGLYEDVIRGQMVEAFDTWCFDAARKVGDYGIVETEFGYHVMYFCNRDPLWLEYARNDLMTERANALLEEASAKHAFEVDYSAIVLGFVDLAG